MFMAVPVRPPWVDEEKIERNAKNSRTQRMRHTEGATEKMSP